MKISSAKIAVRDFGGWELAAFLSGDAGFAGWCSVARDLHTVFQQIISACPTR